MDQQLSLGVSLEVAFRYQLRLKSSVDSTEQGIQDGSLTRLAAGMFRWIVDLSTCI